MTGLKGDTQRRNLRIGRPLWISRSTDRVAARRLREPLDCDVVIIGAGVSGAFMAYELARDFRIVVLDRRAPQLGSTAASTALLQWELDLPLVELAGLIGAPKANRTYLRSRAAVDDLIRIVRHERIVCGLSPKTSLYLAGDLHGARALKTEAEARAALGLESRFLPGADLARQFGVERTSAIQSAGAASADPVRLAAGLLRRARAAGAQLFSPVNVTGVLQGHHQVTVVSSAGLEIRARHVVFCCGYEFPKGVPTEQASVSSTWALATRPAVDMPPWLRTHLVWEASDPYLYVRTTPDGRLMAGGEDEDSATRHSDPKRLAPKSRTIARKLSAMIPDAECDVEYVWAGAFGQSKTSMPLIGPIPDMPRCFAVMGLGGNGITYAVIASQVIGSAIRGKSDPDAALYRFN